MPVDECHRFANLEQQLGTFSGWQLSVVAIAVDALALDELHHQVGQAVLGHSTVDKPRDMRMIDRGEQVLFRLKATQDVVISHLALEQFEREAVRHIAEPLRFRVVESGGPVNFAGGTLPDESLKLVTIDSPSGVATPLAAREPKSPATTLCGLAGHGVFMNPSRSAIAFAASNFSILPRRLLSPSQL